MKGDYVKSPNVEFYPGKLVAPKEYLAKCDTAGSVHLMLQMLLPALIFNSEAMKLVLVVRLSVNIGRNRYNS